jgi:double-stranded uracil-DNA glycosylase
MSTTGRSGGSTPISSPVSKALKKALKGPTRAELLAAAHRTVRNVIAPGLDVLFVGINPGLYTAWAGHHFARPGNRFWPTLHAAGFTDRVLHPSEEHQLLALGVGVTNLVPRATALASELSVAELEAGGKRLVRTAKRYRPRCLAVLGVSSYRTAFQQPKASLGRQAATIGDAVVWVLPNPSGLNAHYQLPVLARLFREMREGCGAARQSAR